MEVLDASEEEPAAPLCHATGNEPAAAAKPSKSKPFGTYRPAVGDNLVVKDTINASGN